MKEKEKAEIKRLSDLLDALNHKDATVIQQGNPELIAQHTKEKEKLATEIERLKDVRGEKLSAEAQKLSGSPGDRHRRAQQRAYSGDHQPDQRAG